MQTSREISTYIYLFSEPLWFPLSPVDGADPSEDPATVDAADESRVSTGRVRRHRSPGARYRREATTIVLLRRNRSVRYSRDLVNGQLYRRFCSRDMELEEQHW